MVSIQFVKFGEIMVDSKVYYSDMIIWWDGEKEFVAKSHILDMKAFSKLLRKNPDMVVVGTGLQDCVRISDDVREKAKDKGIKIFEETSAKAADIFNGMVATGKKVVTFIHTTS
jgi:hypothetical protein